MSIDLYYLRRFWFALIPVGAPLTSAILLINIVVYLAQLWTGSHGTPWMENLLSLSPSWWTSHRYWQLASYAWLHDTHGPLHLPLHLLASLLFIRALGEQLEWTLGPGRFLILYFGGTLASGLTWLYWDHVSTDVAIIGASGAVFALVTAHAAFPVKGFLKLILPLHLTSFRLAILLVGTEALMLHFNVFPEIAHTAHLGGAAFGYLIMKLWKVRSGESYPVGGPISRL